MRNSTGLEYQMSKKMFDNLLSMRTEAEKKENPHAFVIRLLNERGDLRGTVKSLSVSLF